MSGGIVITTRRVEAAGLRGVSTRDMGRLIELSRRRVNFDVSRIAEYKGSTGWHVDDMVEPFAP